MNNDLVETLELVERLKSASQEVRASSHHHLDE